MIPVRYQDDELLPISALSHLVYCKRRCALIHTERVWRESRHTAEGRVLHERVHEAASGLEGGRLVARGLPLSSRRLGLAGVADVVEFEPVPADPAADPLGDTGACGGDEAGGGAAGGGAARGNGGGTAIGVALPGRSGRWRPFPVEFKRGRPKRHNADVVQLCAQAMCLEEMLGGAVPAGALFYGKTRRRLDVVFDDALRNQTERLAGALREMLGSGITPPPEPGPKCKRCSLRPDCMPDLPRSAASYVRRMVGQALAP